MESPLRLEATLNTNTIPASSQARLVYALLQIRASNLPRERVPLSLDLVVDVSLSMHIPIVDEEQFEILAGMGAVSEVMRDGIPTWKFERVPPGFRESCPSPLAFVKQAIQVTLEILHPEDRCGLVAFAQTSRRLAPVLPVSHKTGLLRASEQLDAIDLGDETCLAEGLALAVRELADPGVPPAYGCDASSC